MELVKTCTQCKQTKKLEEFSKASRHKHGRGSWCRICKNRILREREDKQKSRIAKQRWRNENPGYYKRQYWPGLTSTQAHEKYAELMKKQNNVCAICKCPETMRHYKSGEVRKLSVDHCHKTGIVRGLLCSKCNRTIGALGDDLSSLLSVLKYLETPAHS